MDILSEVSETAIITLRSRAIESKMPDPILQDDMSQECLDRLGLLLTTDARKRLIKKKFPSTLARHITLRARKYDSYTREFLQTHPGGLVVSLGCGFDTRYWRIADKKWKYVEIDLPSVIKAKKEILKDKIPYLMIGCSVLEDGWIKEISSIQKKQILFLAEGLFMYLPQKEVENLFRKLADSFTESYIVFETVSKKFTQGMYKKMIEIKMKQVANSTAGSAYQFGVNEAKEIESFGKNIKVVDEWAYFEDEEVKPKFLRLFKNSKLFARTQWTIKATIG